MMTSEEKTDLGHYVQDACRALGKYFREQGQIFEETRERERIDPLIEIFRNGYKCDPKKNLLRCIGGKVWAVGKYFYGVVSRSQTQESKKSTYNVDPFTQVFPQYQVESGQKPNERMIEHLLWLLRTSVLAGENRQPQFRLKLEEILRND